MSKLRESARGRECTVRIPGICNHNPETVVLAHLNGAGMGMKASDIHAAYCCSACHDVLDGRVRFQLIQYEDERYQESLKFMHLEGVIRTQEIMLKEGLIKI